MEITSPHDIQAAILRRIGYGGPKSFSTLREDVPSSKFAFHLDKLQEKELIRKTDGGYELTRLGTEVLPYLKVENVERPIAVVDLFLSAGDAVYLEQKDAADTLDATAGTIRPPSTRASKERSLVDHAEEVYDERFPGPIPDLRLRAVFESATRFDNGATQQHILFYVGAEGEDAGGENWYTVDDLAAENVLPGMTRVAERLLAAENVLHGVWDLTYTGDGVELDGLDFVERP